MDGGRGLCSGSAHCPPYYCERCEFYLLAGYKHYVFACLFSSRKPLQQLSPPGEAVAGRVAACRRRVLVLEMLLLKNVNIKLFATCPPCPRSDAGTSPHRSSLMWQSSIMSVLQREKQRRRKPAPGPYARHVSWDGDAGSLQLRFSLTGWSI